MLPTNRNPLTLLLLAGAAACGRSASETAPGAVPAPLDRGEAAAPVCGALPCDWSRLTAGIDSAVRAGAAPGAVVAVSLRGGRFYHHAGQLGVDHPTAVDRNTVYDLASLTKVVALTSMAMIAVDEGRIRLDDPVVRYLPGFVGGWKEFVTIRHLLTHSSGLPAHRPLWQDAADRTSALALVVATPLDTFPGARMVYSDLGAITTTLLLERVYGQPIDRLFHERIAKPLHLESTRFVPPESWRKRIAPTERDPWRGRLVHGEVHDENAAFLGGVSGHAGLFSTATDLLTFGEWLLRERNGAPGRRPDNPSVASEVAREFTSRQEVVAGSSRALGWDTPSNGSSAGTRLSRWSFGHTGFTGTSIWIDPTRELVIVVLSNRVNPTRENTRIGPFRIMVADRVAEVAGFTGAR
ncbi:MAG: beta-lactamase family protein [Gemmatimonadales bacterium]|nr:beta-lactamase family protein [Gemmatimonadales bacterium]